MFRLKPSEAQTIVKMDACNLENSSSNDKMHLTISIAAIPQMSGATESRAVLVDFFVHFNLSK